ncbi:Cytochrome P450, putative isoform 1 [Theobroma cacao]|uniref:Cytochrome P450, putative isoform 1 n=1 Tax=Theobroma cacao TaxID=3641 RepID=A0A061GVH1_THECC|nr:Cytochrome P450, putative isoform 1 [Theobroma cacao]
MEMWSLWLFLISFLIVSVTTWIYWWRNPSCNGRLPPGSMGLPLIGETFNFLVTSKSIDIHPFIKERMERYGPLFKTSLAGRSVVVSSDPDFNYFVLQQEDKLVELYYMDTFAKLVHKENVNEGGYLHKYLKRVLLSCIGPECLKEKLLSQSEEIINHELHEWTKQSEVEVKAQSAAMTHGFISKILMGCELENSEENLSEYFCSFLQRLLTFPLYIPGTDFYRCIKKQQKVLTLISQLLEERRKSYSQGCNNGDFLGQLVEGMGKEAFLTPEFVSNVIFGLLAATIDTISSAVTLAIKCVLDDPSALQQLTEEHEEILKKREGTNLGLSWEEYKSMTFTHYVIKEALRLASVAPGIFRRVITDIHIDGYTIPKGWILLIIPAALQLNPNIYEDPLTFNPSRWKNMGGISIAKNFVPFGGGNRTCAGAELSKVLMAVLLHVWVTKYRLTRIRGGDVARTPVLEFTNGFFVKVSEKQP